MEKKIKQTKPKKRANPGNKGITPFTERPSERDGSASAEGKEASDLFSYFTANIIKEEKLFTR